MVNNLSIAVLSSAYADIAFIRWDISIEVCELVY